MIYKTLKKVSNVCQLLDKSKFPETKIINGITFTNNGDGSITISGQNTSGGEFPYSLQDKIKAVMTPGHKYSLIGGSDRLKWSNKIIFSISCYPPVFSVNAVEYGDAFSFEWIDGGYSIYSRCALRILTGFNDTFTFKPQLFDLTEMYGAGNEPTTVEQFRQDFPEKMYSYSPYCFVKSYKDCLKVNDYCQLLDKSKYPATFTAGGITRTNNGDGTFTINGTATSEIYYIIFSFVDSLSSSHKYLVTGENSGLYLFVENRDKDNKILAQLVHNEIRSLPANTKRSTFLCYIRTGAVCDNLVFKPQLFDLTEMYGAGNEPTTVEEFKADFPNELYDYKPYSIVPSYKKSLVCTTKNLFDYTSVNGLKYTKADISLNDSLIINGASFTVQFGAYKASACFTPSFILKAGTYTLSLIAKGTAAGRSGVFGIIKFNSDGTLTDLSARWESSNSRQSYTFTLDEDSEVALRLQGYGNASSYDNLDSTFTDIMIEFGSTATDYVPYGHL